MSKIGILGGAFDPPHLGHLIGAEKTRKKFGLQKIIFIPTNKPPHKNAPVASPKERLELIKIATQDNQRFEVSDIEIKRKGFSYTVETIKKLKNIYPEDKLFLIIGMDEAKDFMSWKEPREILRLCKLIILTRIGFERKEIPELLGEKAQFLALNFDISSSKTRELIRKGKSIKHLVPESIENYIKEKKLYL